MDAACGPLQTFIMTQNQRTGRQAIWHTGVGYLDERPPPKFTCQSEIPIKVKKSDFIDLELNVEKIVPASDFCIFITGTTIP